MAGPINSWSFERNKKFEKALAIYDETTPDRWAKIATVVGGTTELEVKARYQILLDDIDGIESGKIPLPNYNSNSTANTGDRETQRWWCMKAQSGKSHAVRKKHANLSRVSEVKFKDELSDVPA